MNNRIFPNLRIAFVLVLTLYCFQKAQPQTQTDYTKFVNLFIGSSNGGNTNPGAVMPWGMASIAPFNAYDTIVVPGRHPSPYLDGRKYISGFTNVNMS